MKQAIKTMTMAITGIVLAFGLTLSSCKKAETGPAGKNGINGNANVQHSGEIDLSTLVWTQAGGDYYSTEIGWNAITQEVCETGLVMAYVKFNEAGAWIALPFSGLFYDNDDLLFDIINGGVRFYYRDNNSSTTTNNPSVFGATIIVRIVAIPSQIKKPNVDHYNYEEVKTAYNL